MISAIPSWLLGVAFAPPLYEGTCIARKAGGHFMSILIFYTATINTASCTFIGSLEYSVNQYGQTQLALRTTDRRPG